MLRNDSDLVVDAYLKSFKYYINENCISLNISCDENTEECFLEEIAKGYPELHIPFDLDHYVQIPECKKSEYWLSVIQDSIKYVSNIWNWDYTFFDGVFTRCRKFLDNKM